VSLDLIATPDLYIVPLFAGHGKHTDQLIPQALGLTGKLTHCDGRTIRYCPPLGTHPAIPQLLGRRAAELCHRENVNPAKTTLLLIAHGSSTGGASQTPDMVAHALRAMNIFAEVVVAYIEQAPAVHDWPNLVHTAMVIAVPLLISDGMHANDDLPPLFGLDKSTGGPAKIHGHRVWLMGGIGHDGELEQMTLDLVRAVGDKAP
jgi:sirohydrochlorin cobaltochelatase